MNIELYKRDFLEKVEEFLGEIEDDIAVKFHVFDGNYWTGGVCAPADVLHLVSDSIHSFERLSTHKYNLPTFRVEITMRHATDRFSFILVHFSETEIGNTVIQRLPLVEFRSRLAMFNPPLQKVFDEAFPEVSKN